MSTSHETFNSAHLKPQFHSFGERKSSHSGKRTSSGLITGTTQAPLLLQKSKARFWVSHSGTAEESAIPGRDAVSTGK
jgi:hypothetical protein